MNRLALLTCLLIAAPALAQQPAEIEGFPDMEPTRFLQVVRDGPPVGLGVSISWLKYNKLFEGELKVFYDAGFKGLLVVEAPALDATLTTERKDSAGKKLEKRQNIQVAGTVRRLPNGSYVLEVKRVYGLEGDLERFTRRERALARNDAAGRLSLAREAIERARSHLEQDERAPVFQLARRLEDQARKIERASLGALPGDAEAWLRFGRRYRQIAELNRVWSYVGVAPKIRERAEQVLDELGAARYLGRWLSQDDYRAAVGFEKLGRQWVPKELVELRQEAGVQLKFMADPQNPWPAFTDKRLQTIAQEGSIVAGQTKSMVLAAIQAITKTSQLPTRVDRYSQTVDENSPSRVWERWEMSDGRVLFFVQGRVFKDISPR